MEHKMDFPADETDLTSDQMDTIMEGAEPVALTEGPFPFRFGFVTPSTNIADSGESELRTVIVGGQLVSVADGGGELAATG